MKVSRTGAIMVQFKTKEKCWGFSHSETGDKNVNTIYTTEKPEGERAVGVDDPHWFLAFATHFASILFC